MDALKLYVYITVGEQLAQNGIYLDCDKDEDTDDGNDDNGGNGGAVLSFTTLSLLGMFIISKLISKKLSC